MRLKTKAVHLHQPGRRGHPAGLIRRGAVVGGLVLALLGWWGAAAGWAADEAGVSTPEEQLRLAEGLLSRNFTDMARVELVKFLEKYPEHALAPRAMLCLIDSYRTAGQVDDALASITQFMQRWPQHESAARLGLIKGDVLLKKGQYGAADECFQKLLASSDPLVSEAAAYNLGQSLLQQGKADLAKAAFAKIAGLPLDPDHPYRYYAAFAAAATAQRQGDFAGAEKDYTRLRDDERAPPAVREEALYRLGEMAFLRGDYAQAAGLYEKQVHGFPDGRYAREGWKRRAWATFKLKNYAQAQTMAVEWGKLFGEGVDPEIQYLLAACLVGLDRYADALTRFQELDRQPALPPEIQRLSAYQQTYCQLRAGKNAEAEELGRAFLKDHPQTPEKADVQFFVAEALFRQGNFAGAVDFFRQALDNFVGDWQYVTDASLHLSECYEKQGNAAAAAGVYRALARRDAVKNKAFMLLRAGEMARRAGELDAAAADFEQLRKDFPNAREESRQAALDLAELHADRKNYEAAIALVNELLQKDPGQAQDKLLLFSGFLLFLQQKYPEAETILRQAAALPGGEPRTAASIQYYLAATLLERHQDDAALELFARILDLPDAVRPAISDVSLFRLEQLFFDRGHPENSEKVCALLARSPLEATRQRAALRMAQLLAARDQAKESLRRLDEVLAGVEGKTDAGSQFIRQEALSVLGEVYAITGQNDRAVTAFQQCLACPGATAEAAARARYGLARIFQKEGNASLALQQAVKTFVLSDDSYYAPRAMLMAIQSLISLQRLPEAVTTWLELRQRYPVFAELQKKEPFLLPVLEAAGRGAAVKQVGTTGSK